MTGAERLAPDARVLVIHVARIGDTLLITPVLRALKGALPQGSLAVLAHPARRALFEHLPFIDSLGAITAKRAPFLGWLSAKPRPRRPWRAALGSILSPKRYDLAIVYGQDAPLIRYAARVARRVIAFAQADAAINRLLSPAVPTPTAPIHAVHERLLPVQSLGVETNNFRLVYAVTAAERESAQRWRAANLPPSAGPLIGFQVASFPTKAYRDWPLESFTALGNQLLAEFPGAHFLVFGGPESRDKAKWIVGQLPQTVSVAGQFGLRTTAALLSQLDLYVGVDTGPTHLAGALGIPMVALYHCRHRGSLLAPLNHDRLAIIEHPAGDIDCGRGTPMANISVGTVFEQAQRLLDRKY